MLKVLLYPFTIIYGIIIFIRNFLYDYKILKSTAFDIPVISVGNISVGGTGKTPHTEYLISLLQSHVNVVTISRGYKRKTNNFRLVETNSTVTEVGDEPLQIKRKFPDTIVAVDKNRVHGINKLRSEYNADPDIIILDDAFQHRRVKPEINILLIDYNRPISKDCMLPSGRLREPQYQQRRADVIIFTKCPEEITPLTRRLLRKEVNLRPYQSLYFSRLTYGNVTPVFEKHVAIPDLNKGVFDVIMLSGIAIPDQFRKYLSSKVNLAEEIIFSDHHSFTQKDVSQINQKFVSLKENGHEVFIFTTEKDATRLKYLENLSGEVKEHFFYIPVSVSFMESESKSFDKKILDYVEKNKSNRRLHQGKNTR